MVPGAKWIPNGNPREWLTPSPYPDILTHFLLSWEALKAKRPSLPLTTSNATCGSTSQAQEGQPGTLCTEEDLMTSPNPWLENSIAPK